MTNLPSAATIAKYSTIRVPDPSEFSDTPEAIRSRERRRAYKRLWVAKHVAAGRTANGTERKRL